MRILNFVFANNTTLFQSYFFAIDTGTFDKYIVKSHTLGQMAEGPI